MLNDSTIPIYLGISFSLIAFIYNLYGYYFCKHYNIKVNRVVMLFDLGFNFVKINKNDITYVLGWLPLGGHLSYGDEEIPKHITVKNRLYLIALCLIIFLIVGWFVHCDFSFFTNVSKFVTNCIHLVNGTITGDVFLKFWDNYSKSGLLPILFIILLLLTTITPLFDLLNSMVKRLSLILYPATMIVYGIMIYKLYPFIALKSVVVYCMATLLSSLVLLFVSMLIFNTKK